MKVNCESCKGTWNASEKIGTSRNCPHCGKQGKLKCTCNKCKKTMIPDQTFEKNQTNMMNLYATNLVIQCPKCKFIGHWADFELVLTKGGGLFGFSF